MSECSHLLARFVEDSLPPRSGCSADPVGGTMSLGIRCCVEYCAAAFHESNSGYDRISTHSAADGLHTGWRSSRCRSTSRSFGHAGTRRALVCVRARVCLCVCAFVAERRCDELTLWTCRPSPAQPSPATLRMRHSAATHCVRTRRDSHTSDASQHVRHTYVPVAEVAVCKPMGQRQCTCARNACKMRTG